MDYNNDNPKKIKKEKEIYSIKRQTKIKWSDIKHLKMEDDDILHIGFDEGYYSENESWEPYYFANVTRMVEETDAERDERVRMAQFHTEEMKKRRYDNYLKLKMEFEGDKQ
jgi:hypothetical protein